MSDAQQRIRERLQTLGIANAITGKLVNAIERYVPEFAQPVFALAIATVNARIAVETIACVERFNALGRTAPQHAPRTDYSLN